MTHKDHAHGGQKLSSSCKAHLHERGATSIEYVLIAVLISIVALLSMQQLGSNLKSYYEDVGNKTS